MRQFTLLIFLFIIHSSIAAQDITGLWKGTLYNDTTGLTHRYEIGISENKGKLTGFSHTWFIVDDKQYFGVKKLKIRKAGDKILVEDDGLISNNYPVAPAKGVRQLNVLTLEIKDSIMILAGPFSTNRTREYRSLTGYINLERKNDFRQSALIPHLQELKLENELSFVRDEQEQMAKANVIKSAGVKEEDKIIARSTITPPVPVRSNTTTASVEIVKPVGERNAVVNSPIIPEPEKPAERVNERVTEIQQTVYFTADSLHITLYDNGEVDGDTVSVLLNGQLILAKQRLSTNAVRHSIYISPEQDSVSLVMYAENLGTIAPNTGLLVIRDGGRIYEVRFSGDLNKNAAIIFRRKK